MVDLSSMSDEKTRALAKYCKKLLNCREVEQRLNELRKKDQEMQKDHDKSENVIKSLQSVGQIVGEVLKQLTEDKFIFKAMNGLRYVVGCRRSIDKEQLKQVLRIPASTVTKYGDIDYEAVVKLSDGFSCADLRNVCAEAGEQRMDVSSQGDDPSRTTVPRKKVCSKGRIERTVSLFDEEGVGNLNVSRHVSQRRRTNRRHSPVQEEEQTEDEDEYVESLTMLATHREGSFGYEEVRSASRSLSLTGRSNHRRIHRPFFPLALPESPTPRNTVANTRASSHLKSSDTQKI